MGRQRIIDSQVVARKLPRAQIDGRRVHHCRIRHNLTETLIADKDPVLIFLDRAAQRAAELVGTVMALAGAHAVVLRGVGVKNRVVEILEQLAMPLVGAGLQRRHHRSPAGAPELRVIGIDHDLELLNGFDAGREQPASGNAHWRPVQDELIGALASAIDNEFAVRIPAAQSRKSVRSELFLSEDDAWRQADQRVRLAADQRQVA